MTTTAVKRRVTLAPAVTAPTFQVIVLPERVPPSRGVTEVSVETTWSVTTTPVAVLLPVLLTVTV